MSSAVTDTAPAGSMIDRRTRGSEWRHASHRAPALGPQQRAGGGSRVPDGRHVSRGTRDAHAGAGM